MAKKISYEEKFEKFKKKFDENWKSDFYQFLTMYHQFKEIESGLVEEKNNKLKSEGKDE